MTRHEKFGIPVALALTLLVSAGCLQVVKLVDISLGNLSAVNGAASAGKYVDLASENSTYADNKDKFSDVSDVAVLGTFKNNLSSPVSAEVWIVEAPLNSTLLPDRAAVIAAGGVQLWSVALAGNETLNLTWDNSAGLFTNKGALESELEGDAVFTLYVFGSTTTYDVTVTGASVAVMIGADLFGGP